MDFDFWEFSMQRIVLKSVLLGNDRKDILIADKVFKKIAPEKTIPTEVSDKVIDASHFAIVPAFYNTHTHAAMTFCRGLSDDVPLDVWLKDYIWPREAKLSASDVYVASRYAILEMIRSGTVFFADMYWHRTETVRAAEELGVRASIGVTFADSLKPDTEENVRFIEDNAHKLTDRIQLSVAPHAIYTNTAECLQIARDCSEKFRLPLHVHLAETFGEENRSVSPTHGLSPVEYLDSLGLLSERTVAAHLVHVSERDLDILASRRVTCAHNPCSNMKLSSGTFCIKPFLERGIRVSLGTDGAASNNNLDMREEMKFASLLAKMTSGDPTVLSAEETLKIATRNGAEAFGIHAGKIADGFFADALLLNLDAPCFATGEVISNFVYAANSTVIDTVICDGNILMENRKITGDREIEKEFRRRFCQMQ